MAAWQVDLKTSRDKHKGLDDAEKIFKTDSGLGNAILMDYHDTSEPTGCQA